MKRITLAILLLTFAAWPAYAQKTSAPVVKPTNCLPLDARPECGNGIFAGNGPGSSVLSIDQIGQHLQQLEKQIVDKAIADTQAASNDAQLRNDIIAQPCWDAETKFLQLLPIEWVANPGNPSATPPVPASPGPPAEMGPALGIQVSRDLINAITGNDKTSLKVACAAMIGDSTKIVGQLLALLGIKAGLAATGIVIP